MGQILVGDFSISDNQDLTYYPVWLVDFLTVYQQLGTDNLSQLENIYHQDVTFIDPIHQVNGIDNLLGYFHNLYTNVLFCNFVINDVFFSKNKAAIYWTMDYSHKKLNNAKTITVQGHSLLKMSDDKVAYHRDYVDVGAMLYEHIPLLGKVVKAVKSRASQ